MTKRPARGTAAAAADLDPAGSEPAKRRGRPPKAKPAAAAAAAPAPKRRGRPPTLKGAVDDDAESVGRRIDVEAPKRRGRPPKPKPVAGSDDDDDDDDVESDGQNMKVEEPKRRGRPPKPKPVAADHDEDVASADDDENVPSAAPKRRGRPPKPDKDEIVGGGRPKPSKPPRPATAAFRKAAAPARSDSEAESADSGRSSSPAMTASLPAPPSKQADAEKGLIAAMKPLSLKRKAGADDGRDGDGRLDQTAALKRARAGRVLVFGTGECAQLGLTEDKTERKFPAPVALNDRIVSIAVGGLHNVAVTSDGEVWTWGCNDEKALGRAGDEWLPGKVSMPVAVLKATAGDSHTMALGADGRVYTWGAYRDTNGLMGFNPNTGEPCAVPIPVFLQGKRVLDIASGVNHSVALLDNGQIFEWGHIRIGQRVARHHRMNLLEPRLVNVRSLGRVRRVFAGAYQSFALTEADRVFAFGMNQYGQAGVAGDGKEQLHKPEEVAALRGLGVVKIAGGLHHSLALLGDGRVLSFGRNNYGELGMGDLNERRTPTVVPGLRDVVDIACGSTHSLAVTKDGAAYSCGFGEMLQLGNGLAEDRQTFEKVGGQQLDDHDVIACGAGAQHSVLIVAPHRSS